MNSGPRRVTARSVKRSRTISQPQQDHSINTGARNELDTRADTICVGKNWRLLSTTGQCCDVHGFHATFDSIKDVPVSRSATAYVDKRGDTYILICNEVLHFGPDMQHSLINPNQIRHFGLPVSDNPYDESKRLGIDHDELFIPFQTEGSAVYFESHVPTDDELETCPHIVLTDGDVEWDPNGVKMTGNRPYGDNTEVTIQEVTRENKRRRAVPIECESDLVLGSISRSLVPDSMYERMVASVRVSSSKQRDKIPHKRTRSIGKASAKHRHSKLTTEHVARLMNIGLDKAKQMMHVTTQKGIRTAVHPIHRRYRVDHLDLHSNRLAGQWYVDWMPAATKSLSQNVGAFVFTNGTFTEVFPTPDRRSVTAAMSLKEFCEDVGTPEKLKSDRAKEFCERNSEFLRVAKKKQIDLTYAEHERKNQIHDLDLEIREIRKRTHNKMRSKNVPKRLWDFCYKHSAKIRQFIPRDKLRGRTAMESVTGKTPDISEYCDFDFYDLVWYHPGVHPSISEDNRSLGRWLGVSHRVGSDMCYWILTKSGEVIAETTVQHATAEDENDPDIKPQIKQFNETVTTRLDDSNFKLNTGTLTTLEDDFDLMPWDSEYDDERLADADETFKRADDEFVIEPDVYDKYIGARVILDGDQNMGGNLATVRRRATDERGRPIGVANRNPLLDTREYEVELENGETDRIFANKLAVNIYSQLDDEGREHLKFKDIIDHRKDDSALTMENGFIQLKNGHKKCKPTTRGWQVLVEWKDDSTTWMNIKDVKEASPIELAEYAIANQISNEPAFAWWVPYVMKKRDRIIAKVKTKYWRTTHKYGVRLPKNAEEALRLDAEDGTTFWKDAMNIEMAKAKVAYAEVEDATSEDARQGKVPELTGFQEIKCHLIFDVKMDFTRKARFVAGGHTTETPVGLTYSSVVSRDSVRIAFLVAALNELDILACDIGNAYLNAPCREKIWFEAGIECGHSMKGKPMKLVRALYGLKSSGASWRKMFKDFIESRLGFVPTVMDPDVYIRRNIDKDGRAYYEYLLVYVDDVLAISHDPDAIMKQIGARFEIKNGDVAPPTRYLGADISQFQLPNGKLAWSMSSQSYCKAAVETVQRLLPEDGRELKTGKKVTQRTSPSKIQARVGRD